VLKRAEYPYKTVNSKDFLDGNFGCHFGFNGMEKVDEVEGAGNAYTTHFRGYDARLGRWISPDPEEDEQPYQSPYCAMDNNPIKNTDPMGDCVVCDFANGVRDGIVEGVASTIGAVSNTIQHPLATLQGIGEAAYTFNQTHGVSAYVSSYSAAKDAYNTVANGTAYQKGHLLGSAIEGTAEVFAGDGLLKASSTAVKVVKAEGVAVKAAKGGRLGNAATRTQVDAIATNLEKRGWEITGGGNRLPEEYLKPKGGGRKGGSYPDITATKDGRTLRVNTVDTYKSGKMTKREASNAARIRSQTPGDHLITIPKKK
jgi:RHS repeat-associated protein